MADLVGLALLQVQLSRHTVLASPAAKPDDVVYAAGVVRVDTDYADQLVNANRLREAVSMVAEAREHLERPWPGIRSTP